MLYGSELTAVTLAFISSDIQEMEPVNMASYICCIYFRNMLLSAYTHENNNPSWCWDLLTHKDWNTKKTTLHKEY